MKRLTALWLIACFCVFGTVPSHAAGGSEMERLFSEGDHLLASGNPQAAIQTWRKIWDLDTRNAEEFFRQLDVYQRFAGAYEQMGGEALPVAAEYLRTAIHYRVPGQETSFRVRLGEVLWKLNRHHEAAQEFRSALDADPKLPNSQLLHERIAHADKTVPSPPDAAGTSVLEPWPEPVECANPSSQLSYHWTEAKVRQTLCAVINEYGRRDGYMFPRHSFEGEANLSIEVVGEQESPPVSALEPERVASSKKDDLPVTVYHHNGKYWRRILSTSAHSLRYLPNKKRGIPDIEVRWNYSDWSEGRELRTVYRWDGKRFQDAQLHRAKKLNAEAVALFAKGQKRKAIAVWQKAVALARVPGLGLVPDAEILNNLGYAYTFAGWEAEKYLGQALQVNPYRWQAHLNLGDYYWNNRQKEKAIESYSRVLRYNPAYRGKDRLQEKIDQTRNAVAALHEVPTPGLSQEDDHDTTSVMMPYAERYAKANGLDVEKLATALGIKDGVAPTDDREAYIMPERGEYVVSSTVRIYELLRAKMKGRDVFFILYNVNPLPGFDDDLQDFDKGWRLAEMSEEYSLTSVHDLYAQTKCEWPEHFNKKSSMEILAGELTIKVMNSEVGRYASAGGSEYVLLPGEGNLQLKKVNCVESHWEDE